MQHGCDRTLYFTVGLTGNIREIMKRRKALAQAQNSRAEAKTTRTSQKDCSKTPSVADRLVEEAL